MKKKKAGFVISSRIEIFEQYALHSTHVNLLVLEGTRHGEGRLNGVHRIKCVGWGGAASVIERERFRNARLGIESNLGGEERRGEWKKGGVRVNAKRWKYKRGP